MSTEAEATAVVHPSHVDQVAAPSPATSLPADLLAALHRRIDELETLVKTEIEKGIEKVISCLAKPAPAAAAAPVPIPRPAPPAPAPSPTPGRIVGCCGDTVKQHGPTGCTRPGCKCKRTAFGARAAGAPA